MRQKTEDRRDRRKEPGERDKRQEDNRHEIRHRTGISDRSTTHVNMSQLTRDRR